MDRATLETKLAELDAEREAVRMDFHRLEGAVAAIRMLIDELEKEVADEGQGPTPTAD